MKRPLACLLSVALLLPHLALAEDDAIPASFKFGADVSTVLSEENSGVVYRNQMCIRDSLRPHPRGQAVYRDAS